jgi:hypothetical protein
MLEPELFYIFTRRLNETAISYMVTGSVASIIYGQPRLTHDVDFVVELAAADLPRISAVFPLDEFYCPPLEVMRTEINRENRGHFSIIHHQTGFKADIYPAGQDELMAWALENRKQYRLKNEVVWVAPAEYVIIRKLQYFAEGRSSKHLTDIRGMLDISGEMIDMKLLLQWIDEFNLHDMWRMV